MLIILVTLNTKLHRPAQLQIHLIYGPVRVMTGDTGKQLPVTWIDHPGSYRVGEYALGLMTATTGGIAVVLKHREVARPVNSMTITAYPAIGVLIRFVYISVPGIRMTGTAHLGLIIS